MFPYPMFYIMKDDVKKGHNFGPITTTSFVRLQNNLLNPKDELCYFLSLK